MSGTVSIVLFVTWTVHLFTCTEQNWSKQLKKKIQLFFWTVADRFGTFFFILWDSLQWVMWQDTCSKRCEQTRCQRNISFFFFKFLLFLFYYILQLCFCTVSIVFCWKPYRTDPIRFKWILHIGSERNGSLNRTVRTEPFKKKTEVDTRLNARYLQKFPWLMIPDIRFPEFLPKRRRICFKSTTLQIFKWKQKDHHIGNILKFLLTHI